MLLMGMDKASYRNSTGGGSKDIPLSSNGIPVKRSVLPVLKTRTLVAPSNKHSFTQSFRDPGTLTKKPHHGSGTFTLSMDHSAARSGIPILTDKPKITHGPSQSANKPVGAGISRNRGQTVNLGSRHKQLANVHEMHLHPKQRTGSMHQYSPGKKFPSLPQISGESRIPLPQATPPSSHLPVLSHGKPPLASPVGAKMSRLPPPVPRSTKFHRSESLKVESTQQPSTGATSTSGGGVSDIPRVRRNAQGQHLPMTPQNAIKEFGHKITQYEKKEILEYPEVWFLGMESKKVDGVIGGAQNSGYDDDNGSYIKVLHDHIVYRYDIREVIGKGSFGQVVKCFDHKTNQPVAIKIIRNKKRFHHQALVEVKLLDSLRKKDRDNQYNIIHMIDYFYFRNHLCITFELMGMNLYELIKKNNFQGFSIALIRRFAYALLQCLKLLVREKIIHCDLKPENILLRLRGQSQIKVIDFGSSCYDHQRVYTYIQSRFYRSPEVILGLPYTMAIDMWSFGAILAELYTGYPLFPGENEVEQLACIMEIFGPPSPSILSEAQRKKLFFDSKGNPRCITNSKGRKRRPGTKDFSSAVKSNDENFLNFLSRCLDWDPAERLTPEEALKHEWILEGRTRSVPRVLPTANSSTLQSPTHHSFQSHVNGHSSHSESSSKHTTTTTSSTNFSSSKRRLQPIGADAKQKAAEKAVNGVYSSKRGSLILEPSSSDAVKPLLGSSTAESSSKCSSSSLNSTTDQANDITDLPSSAVGVAQVLTSKAVPQLV